MHYNRQTTKQLDNYYQYNFATHKERQAKQLIYKYKSIYLFIFIGRGLKGDVYRPILAQLKFYIVW